MSITTLALAPYSRLHLVAGAVAVPALSSYLSPGLVLPEQETRDVLAAAGPRATGPDGTLSASASGVQVWSAASALPDGTPSSLVHLGSVDWNFDTPGPGYATIFRVIVTPDGVAAGATTASILHRVLSAARVSIDASRLGHPRPPIRDPFRANRAI
ncbi:MAG: hypothetical protein M3O55_04200 [Actinomycetota bacterium]|nr:hypothetical protein [Actinomycetota bacterium]